MPLEHNVYVYGLRGSALIDRFVALAMKESLYAKESSIAAAFKHFDKDGSGTITKEELAEALGPDAPDLDDMINEADKNGDGVIDYEEFAAVMRQKEEEIGA